MNVVGKVSNFVTSVATPFHPFGGAVDIIVVKQQDGSFRSTPWYVRFGKFQGVLKGAEKIVKIEVNGVEANFHMHLDASGEASFIEEIVTDKLKNSDSKKHEEDGKKDMKKPLDRKESVRFYDLEVQDEFEVRDERVSNLGNLERKESVKFYDFQDELDEVAEFSEYNNLDNVNSELSLESEVILVSVDGHILTAPITSAEKNGEDVAIDTPRFHLGNTEVQDGDVNVNASSSGSGLEDVYDMIKNQNGESVGIRKDDVFKSCLGLSDLGKDGEVESIRRSPEAIKEEEEVCAKISGNGDVIECSSSDFPGSTKSDTVIDSNVNNEKPEEQIKEVQSGLPVPEEVQGDLPVTVSEEVQGALPVPVSEEAQGNLPVTEEAQGNLPVTKEAQGNLPVTEEVQSGLPVSEEVQGGLPVTEEANNVVSIEGEEIAKVNEVGPTEEKENEKVGPTEGKENEKVGPIEVNDEVAKSKEDESSEIPATTPSGSSRWSLWPNPFRRVKTIEHSNSMVSVDDVFVDFEPAEPPVTETGVPGADSPHKQFVRTNVPTSEHIASLDLKEGQNMVTFIFSTRYLGVQKVDAHIYLWKYNTRIVISDVDGTITKSDVLGQFMPLVGKDWTHTGIAHFFSAIKENGYQLLFLSARAIVQAYLTRSFLFNLKQDGKTLPAGPVVISPDGLFPSLYREVIRRAPHEFKIGCLEDIRALFPPDYNPFYAGFGNRDTDELSYRKIGIPKGKIFIINPKGEVAINRRIDVKSYTSLHTLVHDMFPPTSMVEQEDFNSWNFWKTPLPDIDDL